MLGPLRLFAHLALAGIVFGLCPVFHGSTTTAMLNYPRPYVGAYYNITDNHLSIDFLGPYDPEAALVLDFVPFAANRTKLSQTGVCENRNATEFSSSWTWYPAGENWCDEPEKFLYPRGDLWKRQRGECQHAHYSLSRPLKEILTMCGTNLMNVTKVDTRFEFRLPLYATYVTQANGALRTQQHSYVIVITDAVSTAFFTPTVETGLNLTFSMPQITWSNGASMVRVVSTMPYEHTGQICDFTASHTAVATNQIPAAKACQCDMHCGAFKCSRPTNSCVHEWDINFVGPIFPGDLSGVYTMMWDRIKCGNWTSGDACPAPTKVAAQIKFGLEENVLTFVEATSPFVPFARIAKGKPLADNSTIIYIRAVALGQETHGIRSIELCELPQTGGFVCGSGSLEVFNSQDYSKPAVGNATHLDIAYTLDSSVIATKTWVMQFTPDGATSKTTVQLVCPTAGKCITRENTLGTKFKADESCESIIIPDPVEEEDPKDPNDPTPKPDPDEEEESKTDPGAEDGFNIGRPTTFATIVLTALGTLLAFW